MAVNMRRLFAPVRDGMRFHWEYRKRVLRWAARETLTHVGWNRPTLIVSALTYLGVISIRLKVQGTDEMFGALGEEFFYIVVALTVVGLLVFVFNFLRAPAILQAEIEAQRDNLDHNLRKINDKQDEVDRLSALLSEGIHQIWNRSVTSQQELDDLNDYWIDWQARVSAKLDEPFTDSDRVHFKRLGVVPIIGRGGTFNDPQNLHGKILMEYALKEARLREIIRDHNITHVYLQYDPIISTTRKK